MKKKRTEPAVERPSESERARVTVIGPKPSLTDLPAISIDEILSRLPIKDAAKTSVLSRSWRHRWQYVPELKLHRLPSSIVSPILLLHCGPLRLFSLDFSPSDPIQTWLSTISLRSKSSLRSLTLRTTATAAAASINSIARYFPHLTHLELVHCVSINPSHPFPGFPYLKTLYLERIASRGHLLSIISRCPTLEALGLGYAGADSKGQCLDIAGPNLRELVLCDVATDRFSIGCTPLLEFLVVVDCFKSGSGASDLTKVLGSVPASLAEIVVDAWFLKAWADSTIRAEGQIPISFENLRKMTLTVRLVSQKEVSLTLRLLRSTPNLQELKIKGCKHDGELIQFGQHSCGPFQFEQDFREAEKPTNLFDRLETLDMYWISGEKAELGFVQLVLASARILKIVAVRFSPRVRKEPAMAKLLEFPRTSKQARILLTDRKEDRKASLQAQFSQMHPISLSPNIARRMPTYPTQAPIHPPPGFDYHQQLIPGMWPGVAPMPNLSVPMTQQGQQPQCPGGKRAGGGPVQQAQHPMPMLQQQMIPPVYQYPYQMPGVAGGMLSVPSDTGGFPFRDPAMLQPIPIGALATALANATPEQQKMMLGASLYPLVDKLEHVSAAKVTCRLLEMNQTEVLHLLESPKSLKAKVAETMDALRNVQQIAREDNGSRTIGIHIQQLLKRVPRLQKTMEAVQLGCNDC